MKTRTRLFGALLCLLMFALLIPSGAQAATLVSITVKKTDPSGQPLAGAVFSLTGTGNSINKNYTAESDETGIAEFLNVEDGTYDLKEEMSPRGYALSDEVYSISVYDGLAHVPAGDQGDRLYETITFVNEPLPTYSFSVRKTDSKDQPLAGAVFSLIGTGNSIGQNYEAVSGEDGLAVFNALEGYYSLSEKTAPEGYRKSEKTYEIAIWGGKVHSVAETETDTEYTDYETVTFVNESLNPPTGDRAPRLLCLALLAACAVGAAVIRKKKAAAN